MKKLLFVFAFLAVESVVAAAVPTLETPIKSYGTPVTVSISSSTLTKVPTSQTVGRTGIFLDAPNTNTGYIVGFMGDCTSTALAATIRPIEIAASSNSSYIGLREDVCLWLVTTHSSAENIHYQEAKQ